MRRSVVDEVFEAHEAYRLGQETSGFKSRSADRFQRRMGWVVPGFRERLVDFYDAVKRAPKPESMVDKEATDSVANNPKVVSAWKELAQYFHAHQAQLLELYPRMYQDYWSRNEPRLNNYVIPLKESKSDDSLNLSQRHLLALSARDNIGAWSGRGWANNQLEAWAPRKERAYDPYAPRPAEMPSYPDGFLERMGRQG